MHLPERIAGGDRYIYRGARLSRAVRFEISIAARRLASDSRTNGTQKADLVGIVVAWGSYSPPSVILQFTTGICGVLSVYVPGSSSHWVGRG